MEMFTVTLVGMEDQVQVRINITGSMDIVLLLVSMAIVDLAQVIMECIVEVILVSPDLLRKRSQQQKLTILWIRRISFFTIVVWKARI